jgi:uncharacterized membrane protein YgcG
MDLANILEYTEIEHLESKIQGLKADTTTNLAMLIIPELQREVLERYSRGVADAWELGRCDINNGVLILIAMKDRSLRIEFGLGLESILTNEAYKKIIDQTMIPYFKASDLYSSLDYSPNSIIETLSSSQKHKEIFSGTHNCPEEVRSGRHKLSFFAVVLKIRSESPSFWVSQNCHIWNSQLCSRIKPISKNRQEWMAESLTFLHIRSQCGIRKGGNS